MADANVKVLPAKEADVPALLGLVRELAEYEKLTDWLSVTEEKFRKSLFGDRPEAEALIAWDGSQAVGYAVFFYNYSTFIGTQGIYLEDIYVRPTVRGRGIGKKIFEALATMAKERKCDRLEWMVLNWNQSAIDFYKGLGGEAMDRWTHYRLEGESLKRLAEGGTKVK